MTTKLENAAKHETTVNEMEDQLKTWSGQIDDLVASYLRAGAQGHDPYRLRVDALRLLHGTAQTRLQEYTSVADPTGIWGAFRAGIKDDWKALEDGFKDLADRRTEGFSNPPVADQDEDVNVADQDEDVESPAQA